MDKPTQIRKFNRILSESKHNTIGQKIVLEKCPCGKTPNEIIIRTGFVSRSKKRFRPCSAICGSCGKWGVHFNYGLDIEGYDGGYKADEMLNQYGINEWNEACRKLSSTS